MQQQKSAERSRPAGVWEYRSDKLDLEADLSQYGAERWELVTVVVMPYDPSRGMFYFKRQR